MSPEYAFLFVGFLIIENLYFLIAERNGIVDTPNHRTMHTGIVIRGGGILFYLSIITGSILSVDPNYYFFLSISLVAFVSFLDDIKNLPNKIRILSHFIAVITVLISFETVPVSIFSLIIVAIVAVGFLNAYNFMDGINGITGLYSFTGIAFLLFMNNSVVQFEDNEIMIHLLIATTVFLIYNFRIKAKCFSGDVGSVTMAFALFYLTLKLCLVLNSVVPVFFFMIYGVDTVLTIVHRLINGQNIFEAHKLHLFQILISEGNFNHLQVSLMYAIAQSVINIILIIVLDFSTIATLTIVVFLTVLCALMYTYLKFTVLKVPLKY